jgi:hypothetical protein
MTKTNGGLVLEIPLPFHPTAHAFPGLGLLHPLPLSGLKIHGMLFDFLDDGFLLDPSFKTPQGALERFSLINDDKCQ